MCGLLRVIGSTRKDVGAAPIANQGYPTCWIVLAQYQSTCGFLSTNKHAAWWKQNTANQNVGMRLWGIYYFFKVSAHLTAVHKWIKAQISQGKVCDVVKKHIKNSRPYLSKKSPCSNPLSLNSCTYVNMCHLWIYYACWADNIMNR